MQKKKWLRMLSVILISCLSFSSVDFGGITENKYAQAYDDDDTDWDDDWGDDWEDDWDDEEPVSVDMSQVTLGQTNFVIYQFSGNDWQGHTFSTTVNNMEGLGADTPGVNFSYTTSENDLSVYAYFENGQIVFEVFGAGSGTVTITINEKVFTVTIKIIKVEISCGNSLLMEKGQTKEVKVKHISGKPIWKSSNPKVASVSAKGKIKAKKIGNTIISAEINGNKVGCAVSVVTSARKKVIKRATYIGTHWKYSQPKRMQNNYYDCSSLVWKSYSKYEKKYFGNKNWAPTAADNAKYCATKKKLVKGNDVKNIKNMKYLPGALMFKTGAKNGRFKGIYHVEMFTGYICEGFDENGKPIIGTKWAARGDNYSLGGEGFLWAQP